MVLAQKEESLNEVSGRTARTPQSEKEFSGSCVASVSRADRGARPGWLRV